MFSINPRMYGRFEELDYSLYSPEIRQSHRQQKISAIEFDDLERFKELFAENPDLACNNIYSGPTLLHIAIGFGRKEIFDFMLSNLSHCPLEHLNDKDETPLLVAITKGYEHSSYFALELIKAGADVNACDIKGNAALHYAIDWGCMDVLRALLERGAIVNVANQMGETPLHFACNCGTLDEVALLIENGANIWAENNRGFLTPLDGAFRRGCQISEGDDAIPIQQHLFLLMFTSGDEPAYEIDLRTLLAAFDSNTPILSDFVKHIMSVVYRKSDRVKFCLEMLSLDPKSFPLFCQKFGFILEDVVKATSLRYANEEYCYRDFSSLQSNFLDNLKYLLESDRFSDLMFNFIKHYHFVIEFVDSFDLDDSRLSDALAQDIIACLLTYGMKIYESEVYEIYTRFGQYPIFNSLLYMDVIPGVPFETCCPLSKRYLEYAMPRIIYDVNLTLRQFLNGNTDKFDCDTIVKALDYFANPKLQELIRLRVEAYRRKQWEERLTQMPKVPKLMELARETAREFVIKTFDIKTTKDLIFTLEKLPIGRDNIKLLTYQRKLY